MHNFLNTNTNTGKILNSPVSDSQNICVPSAPEIPLDASTSSLFSTIYYLQIELDSYDQLIKAVPHKIQPPAVLIVGIISWF